jgi:pyranose oxidase
MAMGGNGRDNLVCDVLIIGSGPIGAAFARTLCKPGRKVIMVEAGQYGSRRAGECRKNDWAFQRDLNGYGYFVRGQMFPVSVPPASVPSTANALNPLQDPDTNLPGAVLSYAVGGMAVHWTCAIPEQHPDLERHGFIDADEWSGLYHRARELLNCHTDVFSNSSRHKALRAYLEKHSYRPVDTPLAAERRPGAEFARFSGTDTVLGDLADVSPGYDPNAGFVLLPGHAVRRLVRDPANEHRIVSAEVSDVIANRTFSISADTFVVAAGWLHTPQILWVSGIHTHGGSALGRYLHDHTFTATTIVLREEVLEQMRSEADDVLAAAEDQNDPAPIGISKREPPPHMYLPVSENQLWHGMIFRESFQFDPLPADIDDRRVVDLKWFGMIDPVESNYVEFSADGNRDRLGMPQPTFHVRLGEEDKRRMADMKKHMTEVAGVLGSPLPGYEPREIPLGASTHTMGLTRMGAEDDHGRTSVVDPFSKVWGLDNLYVGGNCVLPTRNACNPTLTSMALALRSADSI